jgi:spore maturation protein CgeB
MRILFSTCRNPRFETISEYIESALRRLGHEVVWFDDRNYSMPGRLRARLPFLEKADLALINRRLVQTARNLRPDILLEAGGERISPETISAARKLGAATALWTMDTVRPDDPRPGLAPAFDFVFCGGTEMLERLRGCGLRREPTWLPFACDPEKHKPAALSEEDRKLYACDIAFVGSLHRGLYPGRIEALESLADLDLGVWGPGADSLPDDSPVKKRVRGGETPPAVWRKIYSCAKIVLCSHYVDSAGGLPSYQASPRVYEAMACGAFVLADRRKDIDSLFAEGKELAVFDGIAALREKAAHYLAHDEQRIAIAKRGQAAVLARHTYLDRVKQLLAAVDAAKA